MNRRTFIRAAASTVLVAAGGSALISYGLSTHDIEITKVKLSLGMGRPLRLAALGDIHFDPLYEEAYVEEVAHHLTSLKLDLVVFTGDFITYSLSRIDDLARLLGKAQTRLGLFAILGNHDMWWGADKIALALEKNGVRVLRNECFELLQMDNFFLTGLESYWGGRPAPSIILRTPVESSHLLFVHEPDPFLKLTDPRIKLQVSGHTHGGQIRMPFLGALRLPKWGKHYQGGLYSREQSCLYVNRGVGTLAPHVRFACRPEITVFELS